MDVKPEHDLEDKFLQSFQRVHCYSSDAIKHYEYFMEVILFQILEEMSYIEIIFEDQKKVYIVHFVNYHILKPMLENESSQMRSLHLKKTEPLLPNEARNRGLSYCAHIVADIKIEVKQYHENFSETGSQEPSVIPPCVFKNVFLFKIPSMVRSKFCHTSTQILDECWMDEGGYFIINGHIKTFIGQKVQRPNVFFIKNHNELVANKNSIEEFYQNKLNTDLEIEVRSLRSDEKFRSTSTLYIHLRGKPPTLTVNIPFLKPGMPIIILFRLLGIHSADEIENILWKKNDGTFDEEARKVFSCNFLTEHMTNTMDTLIDILGKNLKVAGINFQNPNKETYLEKKRRQVKLQIQAELLPHIGLKDDEVTKGKKILYVTKMIQQIVYVYLGREAADDRDFDGLKSVNTCAPILGIMIRQQFAMYIRTLKNKILEKAKKNRCIDVSHILKESITRNILRSFNEGGVTTQRDSNSAPPSTVIQICQNINFVGLQSQLQKVSTSLPRDGKYKDLRAVSTTELFTFCPAETPEGQSCGLLQNLTVMGRIRLPIFTEVLKEIVLLIFTEFLPLEEITEENYKKALLPDNKLLYCNGEPVAFYPSEAFEFILSTARKQRSVRGIPIHSSISQCKGKNINISHDGGIVCFPLLRVDQLHKIPQCLQNSIVFGTEMWEECCREGLVDYVDATELMECRVAFSKKEIDECPPTTKFPFTHLVPIASSFLGICASSVPWSDHDQAPRVSYQAGMVKQAVSVPCTNLDTRFDINSGYSLWYPQAPLAETSISKATKQNEWPMGENLIIAITPWGGWSQEDSIVRNRGSIERGSGRITHYQICKTTCKKKPEQEFFENPTFRKGLYGKGPCLGLRGGANYEKIGFDGLPEIGTLIQNNDVIIGKVSYRFSEEEEYKNAVKLPTVGEDGYSCIDQRKIKKRDKSVIFQCEESEMYVVDNVILTINSEGNKFVKIKLRSMRIQQEGDKISSRHGQKGTIGAIIHEEDLPYVAYGPNAGLRPDAIINVHCINGRMTIGKLLEMLYSSLGLVMGKFPDATPFRDISAEWAITELLKNGYGAEEYMINGITGETYEKPWYIGSCFYQFLKHMVLDKITARQRGPRVLLTRQPLDGRAKGGGQRMGEMEKDALLCHGAAYVLDDRSRISSDEHTVLVCKSCGHVGESISKNEVFEFLEDCKLCNGNEFFTMPTTYCYSKLLLPELATCGIKVTHNIHKT